MSNVSFTANFVSFLPLKLSIRSKSSENRSNGKAGLWVLLATAIAPATPEQGCNLSVHSGPHIALLLLFFAVGGKQLPIARKLQQP